MTNDKLASHISSKLWNVSKDEIVEILASYEEEEKPARNYDGVKAHHNGNEIVIKANGNSYSIYDLFHYSQEDIEYLFENGTLKEI